MNEDDLIVVAGAGGFIGGALVRYFRDKGVGRIRAIDKKPLPLWYQRIPGVECLSMDLSDASACARATAGAREVYNLAADMGGMGFIERFRVECLRSILINTHLIEAAYRAGVERYFFSSSACVYNAQLQADPHCRALRESDAYPAWPERGYGWEKLIAEMFCQEYWAERGMKTAIARFHNVYGPWGTWDGGREKAPAAICRKVIQAKDSGDHEILVWGDGRQTRSFTYIDDCVDGIDRITHCEELVATPVNLGSSEMVSIDELVSLAEEIAGIRLKRRYDINAPRGVAGRNSDNTLIQQVLGWQPTVPLRSGMKATYGWIALQYDERKARAHSRPASGARDQVRDGRDIALSGLGAGPDPGGDEHRENRRHAEPAVQTATRHGADDYTGRERQAAGAVVRCAHGEVAPVGGGQRCLQGAETSGAARVYTPHQS